MKMAKIKLWKILAGAGIVAVLAVVVAACGGGGGTATAESTKTANLTLPTVNRTPSVPAAGTTPAATPAKVPSVVSPTWITPTVTDTTVSVPVSTVESKYNIHFKVPLDKGTGYFMVYTYGGKTYARADICPPCQSINFSLVKNTLVCDSCGTVFSATDGSGISGACIRYPKAAVPYQTIDGNIVMTKADLTKAFEDTISPGLP